MKILVSGGAGYIGSHTCVALAAAGYEPVVVDNFVNSSEGVLGRLAEIIGRDVICHRADVRDEELVGEILRVENVCAVVHFAGRKSVNESCDLPLEYYDVNVGGLLAMLRSMRRACIANLVFSSSATVYGTDCESPVLEDSELRPVNPYGWSKYFAERLITDLCAADAGFGAISLRYFNPVGAHKSGLIGESPIGLPNNLLPFVSQVAVGKRPVLRIFGGDYPTRDGTGVRDYVHVMDLARAHVLALDRLLAGRRGATPLNIGTGKGTTVLELVSAFERVSGREIPTKMVERRVGDVAELWANPGQASEVLGWAAELGIEEMCKDAWTWQESNPDGFNED